MTEGGSVVVIGIGNPSRGDDALGPLLLERIAAAAADVVTVADFQLQVEHALDLRGAGIVLFIDAATGFDEAFRLIEIDAGAAVSPFSHALSPQAVLEVYRKVEGKAPPPAFVLAVRARRFELGEPLSDEASQALDCAWSMICMLLAVPRPDEWRKEAASRSAACGDEPLNQCPLIPGNSSAR